MTHEPVPKACGRVRGRLTRLRDDDLTPLESARDQGHLEACAGCRAEAAALDALLWDIRSLARPAPADWAFATHGLPDALARVAPGGPRPLGRIPRRLAWAAAVAAALFVVAQVAPRLAVPSPWRVPASWRPKRLLR